MFTDVLSIAQIIVAVLLVLCILMQRSSAGIEGALGGGSTSTTVKRTRRGFDRFVFRFTIVLAILFVALMLLPRFL